MYKHILLPTDGSALAREAVQSGILFAKNIGAEVLGLYVIPEPRAEQLDAWLHHDPLFPKHRKMMFDKFADEALSFVANSALAEEVPCLYRKVQGAEPWIAILKVAEQSHCDLIYMASHGWKGGIGDHVGSQTLKILHHSPIPVLVHKPRKAATAPA
ncbi:MAG TPA: universal stress protein [Noviherbaspirillum sp.]|nr:universal stress protein [Noviherbaspirillum sp.]